MDVNELMALQMRYDLPPSLAKILIMLVENQVVTARMIELDHRLTKDAKVAMHRLRRRLTASDVEIRSRRDVGYWLETPSREIVREAMKGLALDGGADGGTPSAETVATV